MRWRIIINIIEARFRKPASEINIAQFEVRAIRASNSRLFQINTSNWICMPRYPIRYTLYLMRNLYAIGFVSPAKRSYANASSCKHCNHYFLLHVDRNFKTEISTHTHHTYTHGSYAQYERKMENVRQKTWTTKSHFLARFSYRPIRCCCFVEFRKKAVHELTIFCNMEYLCRLIGWLTGWIASRFVLFTINKPFFLHRILWMWVCVGVSVCVCVCGAANRQSCAQNISFNIQIGYRLTSWMQ